MGDKLKSLVLGLDGATWDVLLPLIQLSVIPNVGRLVEEGTRSRLRSTLPPLTGPAWVTFATGKNPGQHGFFDWGILNENYRMKMWSGAETVDQPFWTRLSDAGRRVGVFNVPFSYPPGPINGFNMSGMGTPDPGAAWIYPPEIKDEITARLGEKYRFSLQLISYAPDEYDRLIEELVALERLRSEVLLYLLKKYLPDDLVVVYTGPDRVGHFLGRHTDFSGLSDLGSLSPQQEAVVRYYRALDEQVGRVLERVGPDTLVTVVSDHGFTTSGKVFHINDWFVSRGYLSVTPASRLKARVNYLSGMLANARDLAKHKQSLSTPDFQTGYAEIVRDFSFDTGVHLGQVINWRRTRAFSNCHNGVYINTVGRFAQGIVQPGAEYEALRRKIAEDLLSVKDPETGQPVVEEVVPREEVYVGEKLAYAPDLLLRYQGDRYVSNRYFFGADDYGLRIGRTVFRRPSPWGQGDHHRDGVVLFRGPGFRADDTFPMITIEDIAPTILYMLGLPIPTGMTGRVADVAFDDAYLKAHPAQTVDDPALKADVDGQSAMTAEEERLVYERLRELGYLE